MITRTWFHFWDHPVPHPTAMLGFNDDDVEKAIAEGQYVCWRGDSIISLVKELNLEAHDKKKARDFINIEKFNESKFKSFILFFVLSPAPNEPELIWLPKSISEFWPSESVMSEYREALNAPKK